MPTEKSPTNHLPQLDATSISEDQREADTQAHAKQLKPYRERYSPSERAALKQAGRGHLLG